MKIVDCIGDVCPVPVIKAKKALTGFSSGQLEVRVDNEISADNVEKYLQSLGHSVVRSTSSGYFVVHADVRSQLREKPDTSGSIIVFSKDTMGHGDETLGSILMTSFVYTLTQTEALPDKIVLYNRGVLLAVEGSRVLADLHLLEQAGVAIYSCGLCLGHFDCAENLAVGQITNMYAIAEMLMSAVKVIMP